MNNYLKCTFPLNIDSVILKTHLLTNGIVVIILCYKNTLFADIIYNPDKRI